MSVRSARAGALAFALVAVGAASPQLAAGAGEPYLIGAVVSESGPASTLGRPAADSIQLAVDEINAAGGIDGHRLDLHVVDDQSNPTTSVTALRQLLDQHPVAVLGSTGTPTSLAMIPVAEAAQVPLISMGSSSAIVEPAAERHWIFKIPVADTYIATRLQQSMKARKLMRVAVIYRDDDYGKTGLARFEEVGKEQGFQVVDAEAIAATASDATTQLTHVKAANPQAVLAWTTLPSATIVIKGYRELGLTYPLYYSEGSANQLFLAQAGSALDGVLFATEKAAVANEIPASDPQKNVLVHYATEFAKQYPKDGPPGIFGGFGYDAVNVLAAGLRRAQGGGAKLRDALEHVAYVGVSGPYRFTPADHNGLGLDAVELVRATNGKFDVVR
jgi:branched-chain amino acid transport system substrate-binding protein